MATAPTLILTRDAELALLYRALRNSLSVASRRRSGEEAKLASIVSRIKEIQHRLPNPGDY
jgi:hypothetical protein